MRKAALIAALALLPACASLSEEECLAGAWSAIGFDDGASGRPPDTLGEHTQACARHGVAPDLTLWRAGYEDGLATYCTRSNGFRVGATGQAYHGVCTGPNADMFHFALNDGALLYGMRSSLDAAHSDLSAIDRDLRDLDYERDQARKDAASPNISDQQRAAYLDDVARLSEEIGRLERDQRDVERAIRAIETDLYAADADMRRFYPEWSGY